MRRHRDRKRDVLSKPGQHKSLMPYKTINWRKKTMIATYKRSQLGNKHFNCSLWSLLVKICSTTLTNAYQKYHQRGHRAAHNNEGCQGELYQCPNTIRLPARASQSLHRATRVTQQRVHFNMREKERVAWSNCSKSNLKSVASPGIHQPACPKLQHIPTNATLWHQSLQTHE